MESSNGSPAPASQARALALQKKSRVLGCKGGCLLRTHILYPRYIPALGIPLCSLVAVPSVPRALQPVPLEAIRPSKL